MIIEKKISPDGSHLILTIKNPPLADYVVSIFAGALVDGRLDLEEEIVKYTQEAEDRLNTYNAVVRMLTE